MDATLIQVMNLNFMWNVYSWVFTTLWSAQCTAECCQHLNCPTVASLWVPCCWTFVSCCVDLICYCVYKLYLNSNLDLYQKGKNSPFIRPYWYGALCLEPLHRCKAIENFDHLIYQYKIMTHDCENLCWWGVSWMLEKAFLTSWDPHWLNCLTFASFVYYCCRQ